MANSRAAKDLATALAGGKKFVKNVIVGAGTLMDKLRNEGVGSPRQKRLQDLYNKGYRP